MASALVNFPKGGHKVVAISGNVFGLARLVEKTTGYTLVIIDEANLTPEEVWALGKLPSNLRCLRYSSDKARSKPRELVDTLTRFEEACV